MKRVMSIVLVGGLVACQKHTAPVAKPETSAGSPDAKVAAAPAPDAKPSVPTPTDVAAPPADAQKTDLGVFYKVLAPGRADGKRPNSWDSVSVNYAGWTTDGKMFDRNGDTPLEFPLQGVIKGWGDGLQTMQEGGKTRFWIPEELAYQGSPSGPQGMLVFDVELLKVMRPPGTPETPSDLAAPPASAKKTKLGVHYVVLQQGTGNVKLRDQDRATAKYSGWTMDGKMFVNARNPDAPQEIALPGVIPGFADALKTMVVGQVSRFWIPEEIGYKKEPGKPKGDLVFEVELLSVRKMPDAPKDLAKPPRSAAKTAKGVTYRYLKKGKGTEHPKESSTVVVRYSGWTKDGKLLDSNEDQSDPSSFALSQMIEGWRDALQVMVVGDKARFWIPSKLAYGDDNRRAAGDLVFDIELIEISEQTP